MEKEKRDQLINRVMRPDREDAELMAIVMKIVQRGVESLTTEELQKVQARRHLYERTIRAFAHEILLIPEILKERLEDPEKPRS